MTAPLSPPPLISACSQGEVESGKGRGRGRRKTGHKVEKKYCVCFLCFKRLGRWFQQKTAFFLVIFFLCVYVLVAAIGDRGCISSVDLGGVLSCSWVLNGVFSFVFLFLCKAAGGGDDARLVCVACGQGGKCNVRFLWSSPVWCKRVVEMAFRAVRGLSVRRVRVGTSWLSAVAELGRVARDVCDKLGIVPVLYIALLITTGLGLGGRRKLRLYAMYLLMIFAAASAGDMVVGVCCCWCPSSLVHGSLFDISVGFVGIILGVRD